MNEDILINITPQETRVALVLQGAVQELHIEVLDGAERALAVFESTPGISAVERAGNEFQMQARVAQEEMAELHARLVREGVRLLSFEQDRGSLEDVFLSVTKGGV